MCLVVAHQVNRRINEIKIMFIMLQFTVPAGYFPFPVFYFEIVFGSSVFWFAPLGWLPFAARWAWFLGSLHSITRDSRVRSAPVFKPVFSH